MTRILVVDDEAPVRQALSTILVSEGYEVETAADGNEALERLGASRFDMLLSDLRMVPVDGMQLARAAHRKNPNVAIVMLTGYATLDTAMESLECDVFDYLLKPIRADALLDCVSRAVEYSRAREKGMTDEEKNRFEAERDKSLKSFMRTKRGPYLDQKGSTL